MLPDQSVSSRTSACRPVACCMPTMVVVEQDWRERLAHVPFEIMGDHAQQHVRTDPIGQAVTLTDRL
jgi:hypothetical protein